MFGQGLASSFFGGVPLRLPNPFLPATRSTPIVYLFCPQAHFSPELRYQGILIWGLSVPKSSSLQLSPSSAFRVLFLTQAPGCLIITRRAFIQTSEWDRCALASVHMPGPASGFSFSIDSLYGKARRFPLRPRHPVNSRVGRTLHPSRLCSSASGSAQSEPHPALWKH